MLDIKLGKEVMKVYKAGVIRRAASFPHSVYQ
jgi:hypothetical protein